jgi:hypothetical protein
MAVSVTDPIGITDAATTAQGHAVELTDPIGVTDSIDVSASAEHFRTVGAIYYGVLVEA